jgi:glyoxylase-like metal-dependent hydrolase (beta-lactamase superfamily II)
MSRIINFHITMQFGNTENTIYPTLLWDDENIILVDCGFIGSLPLFEKELQKLGLSIGHLTGLVLTHHDHDHMGSAAEIKRINPKIKVYSSAAEAPYITAAKKPLRLKQAEELQKMLPPEQQSFGKAFCDLLRRVEPVSVDYYLNDGDLMDWCGGCRIIATPGHTPGHISLYFEKESVIITGDAIALENGKPVVANPQFTLDLINAQNDIDKLLSLNAKVYYCYHGGVFTPDEL